MGGARAESVKRRKEELEMIAGRVWTRFVVQRWEAPSKRRRGRISVSCDAH